MSLRAARAACLVSSLVAMLASEGARAQSNSVRPTERMPIPAGETLAEEVAVSADLERDDRLPVYVLRSELELEIRYHLIQSGVDAPLTDAPTPLQLQAAIEQTVAERLIEREAIRASDPPPSDSDIEQERSEIFGEITMVGGVDLVLRASNASRSEFDAFVRRRVVALAFLLRHLPRTIEPTDQEIRAAYESERIEPFRARGVPPGVARRDIRAALIREGYPRAARSFLRSLGSRARIRVWGATPH